ncbi:MAG: ABC transporter substrate-binding protein [Candidatus Omnitrophica bacterium]|nr:ABC transporter substrate-binding protein [Candidatus Omnitrophota bacterium]
MNKKDTVLWFLVLILCAGLTVQYGCSRRAAPPPSEVAVPRRIISLSPALTEELYLLGVQDRLVGCTTYCNRPEAARQKPKVGTVVEVSVEKIVDLRPDLILVTSLTDRRAKEHLRQLGMNVVLFSEAKNFNEICQQFLNLGKIVGKEERARKIVGEAKREVNSIAGRAKGITKPKVFLEIGTKPLFTVTRDSFVNDFIVLAGGINIASEARSGLYSREKVVAQNPDVIIIVSMGVAADQEKKVWQKFRNLSAVKNDRIYVLDADKVCSPTPPGFVKTLKEISLLLHPGS